MTKELVKAIPRTETNQGLPCEVSVETVKFSGGTSYQISEDSRYVELKYSGRAKLTFLLSGKLSEMFAAEELTPIRAAIRTVYQWREIYSGIASPFTLARPKTFDFQANLSTS